MVLKYDLPSWLGNAASTEGLVHILIFPQISMLCRNHYYGEVMSEQTFLGCGVKYPQLMLYAVVIIPNAEAHHNPLACLPPPPAEVKH